MCEGTEAEGGLGNLGEDKERGQLVYGESGETGGSGGCRGQLGQNVLGMFKAVDSP